ncbi:NAD(P)H-dependent oxidoreductase [Mobilitalea sibirica]|uniref:NAD(P)H-dependent oxidoreductase n=1 Tax=Mobilitalea sibirica TaxID=1462919 RepID=A0A8J7KVZ9_9FIRM|nr:NAD(P)H-dependent oxidoreductase [Mobilitalea sibirica]MBH1939747.1 NAD(P)H-dependent oxidoreductase [Mobilitalea sibirica]
MNIVVLNGTPVKGITYHMKEMFLSHMRDKNQVTEFYPKDFPPFCVGCKACFLRGEEKCPHYNLMEPIWNATLNADLLVFAYPVYALRAPASIKSVLDHYCVHWMAHRPEPEMFEKTAVIITNSVGAPNGSAQKDVKTSMSWMGVSKVYTYGVGMMGDIFWNEIKDKNRIMLERKMESLANKVTIVKPRRRKSLKVNMFFLMCKKIHKSALKSETELSLDTKHYIKHGWIKPRTLKS